MINTGEVLTTEAILHALLGRPTNIDCGDRAYLTDLAPIMHCDTNKIPDLVRIVSHAKQHYGRSPLVLRMTGDGQSVLTLSWLKRRWPEIYKNVLITNGHWHSHGHFMLQGVKLFWPCFYRACANHLHQLKHIDPLINNLEKNAYMHYTNFIFSVHVASVVFIVKHVTEPPPELFLSNPVRRLWPLHVCPPPPTATTTTTATAATATTTTITTTCLCRSYTVLVSITLLALCCSRPCANQWCIGPT